MPQYFVCLCLYDFEDWFEKAYDNVDWGPVDHVLEKKVLFISVANVDELGFRVQEPSDWSHFGGI